MSFKKLSNGYDSCTFRIPWTKTTKQEGAEVVLTSRPKEFHDICPLDAITNHLRVNSLLPSSFPLFSYIDELGSPTMYSKTEFLDFCRGIWQDAALYHIFGHSFRIGGAVELLLAGVPPEVVAATGGWNSLAFLVYWRKISSIIPQFTSKAYSSTRIQLIDKQIDTFRKNNSIPTSVVNLAVDGLDLTDD